MTRRRAEKRTFLGLENLPMRVVEFPEVAEVPGFGPAAFVRTLKPGRL